MGTDFLFAFYITVIKVIASSLWFTLFQKTLTDSPCVFSLFYILFYVFFIVSLIELIKVFDVP